MQTILITTLAEYQTAFWVRAAELMRSEGREIRFISFDDRSTDQLRAHGFDTTSFSEERESASAGEIEEAIVRLGPADVNFWSAHERVAYGIRNGAQMRSKLGQSLLTADRAIEKAGSDVVMLQELGGFLAVVGSYFAARHRNVDNVYIEPSFFRGRFHLTPNSFGAPEFRSAPARYREADAYIDRTIGEGAIVVPKKDSHHYSSAFRKVVNPGNARRLAQKLVDKHLLGKKQEFGHIGRHVRQHARMLVNSRRIQSCYEDLGGVGPFIYYPFHVPGDVALTLRAPEFLDQLSIVDFLCRTAPDGFKIVVKEHPAMIGGIDAARLAKLSHQFENLAILSPATNNYRVLNAAAAVITVNSKSGAEAGLLGKPAVVLGDAFYRTAPFSFAVDGLGQVPDALREALNTVAPSNEDVRNWFAGLWSGTVAGELYHNDPANLATFAASITSRL